MTNQVALRSDDSLEGLMKVGAMLAKSGYFKDATQEAQAVAKVLAGHELGVSPVAAMTGINLVQGRVTLSANLMAALVKKSGRYDYRVKHLDSDGCSLEFFESGKTVGFSTFTMDDAVAAELTKSDPWKKYPRNMLFSRCMTNGVKLYCPDISVFPIYTPDELGAEIDGETGEMVWTPAPTLHIASAPQAAIAAPLTAKDAFKAAAKKANLAGQKAICAALGLTFAEGVLDGYGERLGWDVLRKAIEDGRKLNTEQLGYDEASPDDDQPDDTAAAWMAETAAVESAPNARQRPEAVLQGNH